MRRKKGQEQEAPATGDPRVTPADVQGVEFKLAFRGYSERDVDAFLDRLTEDLSSYLEENERLRQGLPPATSGTATDEGADAIVTSARDEAAAIIRRAEQDAAAIRAAAGTGAGGDARTALAPFLNREREFLQGLGSLVQTHAEEIKEMVLAIRARTEGQPTPAAGATAAAVAGPGSGPAVDLTTATDAPDRPIFEPATTAEMRERMADEPALALSDEREDAPRGDPDTVVVDSATEPVFSTEGSPGSAPAGDRRERSLRELFWGED